MLANRVVVARDQGWEEDVATKEYEGTFRGDGNVVYPYCGRGYMNAQMC